MAYHILVVDDEPIVRTGLLNFDWEAYGFEAVSACENGREALEWLSRHHVEVVLTDIKMPGIDGVELSRQIRERYLDILVILLTGYNEFSYAQQVIKSGVFDYLLKPAEDSDFEKVLVRAYRVLREREKQKELLDVLSHNFVLRNQLNECHMSDEVMNLFQQRTPFRQNEPFRLCLVYLEHDMAESDLRECLENWHFVQISRREWVAFSSNEETDALVRSLVETNGRFNAGISSLKHGGDQVLAAFLEANKALQRKFLCPEEHIFHYADHLNETNDMLGLSAVLKKIILLTNRLNALNPAKLEGYLSGILQEIETNELSEKQIKQVLSYLVTALEMESAKLPYFLYEQWLRKKNHFMHAVHTADRFEIIKQSLLSEIGLFIDEVNKRNARNKESAKLEEVLRYIHENYNKVLSLDLMAEHVAMHPNTFSKWFKENMGINFIDYVTRYRIDKAKELLERTELKTSQIAEQVGIPDARYFGQVFKKLVDLTPSEYRMLFK